MNERIKEVRNGQKLSQDAFGEMLGVTKISIYMFETGRRNPSDRTIKDICRVFHVNEEWLRTGEGEMYAPVTRESQIADICASLHNMEEDSKQYKLVTILNSMLINMTEEQIDQVFNLVKELYDSIYKE